MNSIRQGTFRHLQVMRHPSNNRHSRLRSSRFLSSGELKLSYEATAALTPDQKNARLHGPDQLASLKRSLTTFGFITPIVVDASGKIVCGHARWLAARDLGISKVPVIRVEHMTATQLRAFAIADNRLTEGAIWHQESIVGSVFEGSYRSVEGGIIPTIAGRAFVCGEGSLLMDDADPFCWGITPAAHTAARG